MLRLDIHSELIASVLKDQLHVSPIDASPQHVLELKTGTGTWAIKMG